MIKKRFYIVAILVHALISTVLYAEEIDKCSFPIGLNVFNDSGTISLGECQTHLHLNGNNKLGVLNENLFVQGKCFSQCDGERCVGSGIFANHLELPTFLYTKSSTGSQTIQNSTDTINSSKNNIVVQTNGRFDVSIDNTTFSDIASLVIRNNSDFRFNYSGNTPYVIKNLKLYSGNSHTITFEPGTYFIENFRHQAGTNIEVKGTGDGSGSVKLYIKGDVKLNGGHSNINFDDELSSYYDQSSDKLFIISYDGDIRVQANVDIAGFLYADNGDVDLKASQFNFTGAAIGNNIRFQNSASFWSSSALDNCTDVTTPIAFEQNLTTNEDTNLSIELTTNTLSEEINYFLVSEPVHGTLSGTLPNLIYTPHTNYFGSDTFTFKVDDNGLESEVATIKIDVLPVNDAPIALDDIANTNEGTNVVINVLVNDSDIDGTLDISTLTLVSQATNGFASVDNINGNIVYTPGRSFIGSDQIKYIIKDNENLSSNVATVDISVLLVNQPPIASSQDVVVHEDVNSPIILNTFDREDDNLTYVMVKQPSYGKLNGTAPELTYTPNINYNGIDSFSYYVNDGEFNSSVANVNLTVLPVNDIPIAYPQKLTLQEDSSKIVMLSGVDIDADELSFNILTQPEHGVLSGSLPNIFYIPEANYYGEDSFTFNANDGEANSSIAQITLNVTFVNDAPVGLDDIISVNEDEFVMIDVLANDTDIDGTLDKSTLSIVKQTSNATLSVDANGKILYTPNINYFGEDNFQYTIKDNNNSISNVVNVSVKVNSINDLPIASNQQITLDEDTSASITLSASDTDDTNLSYSLISQPVNGTISGNIPNLIYTPKSNYYGKDSFTFNVNDGELNSSIANIDLTVLSVNDAPIGVDDNITTDENVQVIADVLQNDIDVDGTIDADTFTITKQALFGLAEFDSVTHKLIYTPNENYYGSDTLEYTVKDDNGTLSNNTSVFINVIRTNNIPLAESKTITLVENSSKNIELTGSDIDNDPLEYILVTLPTHGTLTGTAPSLIYIPNKDYTGEDSFKYKVNDSIEDSEVVDINITVTRLNTRPIANFQNLISIASQEKNILLSGYDKDGDELSYQIIKQSSNGTLSGAAPNISYTPNNAFEGVDCFAFKVNDGIEDSEEAVVTISSYPKYSINSVYPDGTIAIEELLLHINTQDNTYIQRLVGYNNDGNLKENNLLYDINSQLDSSGYGAIYVTIKNNQANDLNNIHISFLADLSIEENQNTFFNEYGEYIGMDTGLEGIKADTWQIDEPDYLQGQIVQNAKNAELSQMNHIDITKKDDVAMALGFKIDLFKQNDILSFKIILSNENIGGLKQIDYDTNTSVHYNIIMNEITTSSCSMN